MSRWWMVLALVVLAGCASNKAMVPTDGLPDDEVMGGEAAGSAQGAQDEVDALVRQIEAASGGYREEFGIEDPQAGGGGGEKPTDLAAQEPASCETVCEAAKAICGSGDRICTIASENPGQPEFGERCAWAGEQCAKARSGCEACGP